MLRNRPDEKPSWRLVRVGDDGSIHHIGDFKFWVSYHLDQDQIVWPMIEADHSCSYRIESLKTYLVAWLNPSDRLDIQVGFRPPYKWDARLKGFETLQSAFDFIETFRDQVPDPDGLDDDELARISYKVLGLTPDKP